MNGPGGELTRHMVQGGGQSITDRGIDVTQRVCPLNTLADPGARGIEIELDNRPVSAFLVRKGEKVFCYVNVCPHAGNPLEWKPHAFLTRNGSRIMCSRHGAVFEIESGVCVERPCPGSKLRVLRVGVEKSEVVLYEGAG